MPYITSNSQIHRLMKHFLLLIFSIALFTGVSAAQTSLKVGQAAPPITLSTINGDDFDLSQTKGKVVMLTFWSTRCEICRNEIPLLNKLKEQFPSEKVDFYGLAMDNEPQINKYLKTNPFKFTIVPEAFSAFMQYADKDRSGMLQMGYPAYFILDRNGKIAYRGSGWDRINEIQGRINSLLTAN